MICCGYQLPLYAVVHTDEPVQGTFTPMIMTRHVLTLTM